MALRIGDLTAVTVLVGTSELELSLTGSSGSRKITVANFFNAVPVAVSLANGLTVTGGATFNSAVNAANGLTVSVGNLTVTSGVISAVAANHRFGSASGTAGVKGNQNILLYDSAANNWAGIQADVNGSLIVSVGIASRFSTEFSFGGGVIFPANITTTSGSLIFGVLGRISPSADGIFQMLNNASTGFSKLIFGTTGAGSPALRVTGTRIDVVLANESAFAAMQMDALTATTGTFSGAVSGSSLSASDSVFAGAAAALAWSGRSLMRSPSDGSITLLNAAETSFSLLQFGGVSSSFPALIRSGANLRVRLADDSGDTGLFCAALTATTGVFAGAVSGITTLTIGGAFTGATTGAFSGAVTHTGATADLILATAGSGIRIKEGTNATMGNAQTSGGSITVNTTKVTANSRIFLSAFSAGADNLYVSARTPGTSFVVTTGSGSGNINFVWMIVEPSP